MVNLAMQTQINLQVSSLEDIIIRLFFSKEKTMDYSTSKTEALSDSIQIEIQRSPKEMPLRQDALLELEILMRPA